MDDTQRRESIRNTFLTTRHFWHIESSPDHRCIDHFKRSLPHIADDLWGDLLCFGGAYRNRIRVSAADLLSAPCQLELFEPKGDLRTFFTELPSCSTEDILFQDDDIAVVVKPAGIPTTPVRDLPSHNLMAQFADILKRPVHPPSRLDSAVMGVVLLSLSDRMNRYCQKAHERGWFVKEYVAEVEGSVPWGSKELTLPIGRHPHFSLLRSAKEGARDLQDCETHFKRLGTASPTYRVVDERAERSLILARPITGRTHQIRVHLAALGFPIVGDPFYGLPGPSVHLVSMNFSFFHPYAQRLMAWSLPQTRAPDWLVRAGFFSSPASPAMM
jgi:23S rRNA-/tRNA-specific pseudouridylate synthase